MNPPVSTQIDQINQALKEHDFAAATEVLLELNDPEKRALALAHVMREWGKESALAPTFAKLLTGKDREIALTQAAVGRAQSSFVTAGLAIRYVLELPPGESRDRAVAEVLLALGRRADNPQRALLTAMQILKAGIVRASSFSTWKRKMQPTSESPRAIDSLVRQLPEGKLRQRALTIAQRERRKRGTPLLTTRASVPRVRLSPAYRYGLLRTAGHFVCGPARASVA